jgi:hypothetical protein
MFTIFRGSQANDHEALIQDVAKEVARLTCMDLGPTTSTMNAAELRGYLRTRAARQAREQVRRTIAEVRLPQGRESEFTAAVLERAIHLMVRVPLASPIISIPAPHVQSRAA